jgi:hypothetical protein
VIALVILFAFNITEQITSDRSYHGCSQCLKYDRRPPKMAEKISKIIPFAESAKNPRGGFRGRF